MMAGEGHGESESERGEQNWERDWCVCDIVSEFYVMACGGRHHQREGERVSTEGGDVEECSHPR